MVSKSKQKSKNIQKTKQSTGYKIFVNGSISFLVLLSLSIAALYLLDPKLADWLTYEDFIAENIGAGAAVVAALVIASASVYMLFKKNLAGVFGLLIAAAFFIIGMEEISWMQRILNIESDEFFQTNNMQAETNFHNLDTILTMSIFYALTYIIFFALPFFSKRIKLFLEMIKLSKLDVFVPSAWILVAFTITIGFAHHTSIERIYHVILLLFTVAAYGVILFYKKYNFEYKNIFIILIVLMTAVLSAILFHAIDYDALGIRSWSVSEYRETLICLVILVYAVDLTIKIKTQRPLKLKRR